MLKNKITKEQFAIKWEESKDKFYRMAFCYVKNENDALEILSEATYRAYCSIHKIHSPEYFDTWMNKIVINSAYDFLKRKNKFVPLEEYIELDDNDVYIESEDKIDMYNLLEKVSAEEKTLLILKYFEERSFKDIGEMLGISENTVKTRTYRILSKLRLQLERENIYGREKTVV